MGISDDIKPKQAKAIESAAMPEPTEEPSEAAASEEVKAEESVEIPIDKEGTNHPIYEDLLPRTPKPFDHLNKSDENFVKPATFNQSTSLPEENFAKSVDSPSQDEKPVPKDDSFRSFTEYHAKQPRKSHLLTIIIILFVLLLATLLVLQNLDQIKGMFGFKNEVKTDEKPISTGVEIIGSEDFKPSDTSTATTTPSTSTDSSNTTTPTSTPAPAAAPTPTTTPAVTAPANLAVRVLNGNGISGSAAAVKAKLVAAGYTIGAVSNASKFTYTKTVIYYNTNRKAEADAIAALLSDRQTEVILNPAVTGASDLIVVVGKS